MKSIFTGLCLLLGVVVQAQYYPEHTVAIKAGAGYAHDFPGLNGYSVFVEGSRPLSDKLQGAIGFKLVNMSGYPRTTSVNEFTKATTIDFNIYFVPLTTEMSELRIGAGYSFSFYNIRRSFPVVNDHETTWPVSDGKGRVSGFNLIGEYEYFLPESNFSIGCRASMFKAYDRVTFAGVFAGVRL